MSSDNGRPRQPTYPQTSPQPAARPRLNIGGDLPAHASQDRLSTVMVHADDPTPPPRGINASEHDPDDTFPPGVSIPAQRLTGQHHAVQQQQPQGFATGQHNAAHLQQGQGFATGQHNAAHLQQGQGFATGQHNAAHLQQGQGFATGQHNAAHLQQGFTGQHNAAHLQQGFTGQHNAAHLQQGQGFATGQHNAAQLQQGFTGQHNAAHLQQGFTGPLQAVRAPGKKTFTIAGRNIELPGLGFSDASADSRQRVIYSISATLTGGLLGFVLGAFNARLQGWTISEGTREMHILALICALTFGIMAFMRPQQVDQVLVKLGLLSAADADPDRTDEIRLG
ncbi:hypothetical protein DL240_16830 [Lujinxingia litoralis]|uniref:Uncharacterized protein n=1 Tax=Lujinxingia litoralis TaxID=2211119 RepID=A0A328C2G4_9DELT|nr:hypothetical protein [Lujinxingia litoralis]RAL20469.1 hypothetical protein DL240_16830 [Lujinxingia litoralis]